MTSQRRKERDAAAEGLRVNYWKLDPYLRAKSLYDRIGLVGELGKLSFYPEREREKENAKPAAGAAPAPATAVETSAEDLD